MRNPLLVVVAHDAGGAEVISSWLQRIYYPYPGLKDSVWLHVVGPAKSIFERKLGELPKYSGDPTRARLVLCGSSVNSWIERDGVRWARDYGIRSVVWLDHWANYRERFDLLPDEIWVCDEYALDRAISVLPTSRVMLKGNPYLEDVARQVKLAHSLGHVEDKLDHVLCVFGPTALGQDIFRFPETWKPGTYVTRMRPHPTDAPSDHSIAEDIAWADIVVGFDSMALVVALKAGKRVFSLLLPEERTIPYEGIVHLSSATKLSITPSA